MPPGTPLDGFILPYKIRVDAFSSTTNDAESNAQLYMLSHTHSDHIVGLSAKSFASKIVCSKDSKTMLLRHEVLKERMFKDSVLQGEGRDSKTFRHLKLDPVYIGGKVDYTRSRDLLSVLPLDTPTDIELTDDETVTVTLIDANHCPGAVMFLVEGKRGAVLHTGDFRAEHCFLQRMATHPRLHKYLAFDSAANHVPPRQLSNTSQQTLKAVYLDTACVFSNAILPAKNTGINGLIELMKLMPESTVFYINAWTWGYEDILKAISNAFDSKVHVDRYKHDIYMRISDDDMRRSVTRDAVSTRFHSCERFDRCEYASEDAGRTVVYINPVTFGEKKWDDYKKLTESQLRSGEKITCLLVPLARHSSLPELRSFVSLFRPECIVPNTVEPKLGPIAWKAINSMFSDCLSPGIRSPLAPYIPQLGTSDDIRSITDLDVGCDAALDNLLGSGADELASEWAEKDGAKAMLEMMENHLSGVERALVRRLLGKSPEVAHSGSVSILEKAVLARRIDACRRKSPEPLDEDEETQPVEGHTQAALAFFGDLIGIKPELKIDEDSDEEVEERCATPTPCRPTTLKEAQMLSPQSLASGTKRRPISVESSPPSRQVEDWARSVAQAASGSRKRQHGWFEPSSDDVPVPEPFTLITPQSTHALSLGGPEIRPPSKSKRRKIDNSSHQCESPFESSMSSHKQADSSPESACIAKRTNENFIPTPGPSYPSACFPPGSQASIIMEKLRKARPDIAMQRDREAIERLKAMDGVDTLLEGVQSPPSSKRKTKLRMAVSTSAPKVRVSRALQADASFSTVVSSDDDGVDWERSMEIRDEISRVVRDGGSVVDVMPRMCYERRRG